PPPPTQDKRCHPPPGGGGPGNRKFVMTGRTHDAISRLADRCWRVGLVVGEIGGRIRSAVGHAEHGNVCFQVVEVQREVSIEQGFMAGFRCDGEWLFHHLYSLSNWI